MLENRRTHERRDAAVECCIRLTFTMGGGSRLASVHDVSRGGAGLLLAFQGGRGTCVQVEFRDRRTDRMWTIPACVAHAEPSLDGRWLVGIAFDRELESEELQALLPDAAREAGCQLILGPEPARSA